MIDAREAKVLSGIDPRTTQEQFLDDMSRYIKFEAELGHRRMRYLIPDKFSNPNLITIAEVKLEDLGFDVYYDTQKEMLDVRW